MSSNALVNDVSLSSRPRYDISARQFESHPLRQVNCPSLSSLSPFPFPLCAPLPFTLCPFPFL